VLPLLCDRIFVEENQRKRKRGAKVRPKSKERPSICANALTEKFCIQAAPSTRRFILSRFVAPSSSRFARVPYPVTSSGSCPACLRMANRSAHRFCRRYQTQTHISGRHRVALSASPSPSLGARFRTHKVINLLATRTVFFLGLLLVRHKKGHRH